MTDLWKIDEDGAALDLLIKMVSRMIRLDVPISRLRTKSLRTATLTMSMSWQQHAPCNHCHCFASCALWPPSGYFESLRMEMSVTPRARYVFVPMPGSLHYSARFWTAPGSWNAWGVLDVALGGEIPHQVAWNASRFEYLSEHPGEGRILDAFVASMPDDRHNAVSYLVRLLSGHEKINDLGGGNGERCDEYLLDFQSRAA